MVPGGLRSVLISIADPGRVMGKPVRFPGVGGGAACRTREVGIALASMSLDRVPVSLCKLVSGGRLARIIGKGVL